jgi:hypothetical protein
MNTAGVTTRLGAFSPLRSRKRSFTASCPISVASKPYGIIATDILSSFYFEYYRFCSVRTTGDEHVFIFHPSAKITICHQDHNNLVNVVPGPVAFEVIWAFGKIVHSELIPNFEEWTRAFVNIRPTIFICQILVIKGFQKSDMACGE